MPVRTWALGRCCARLINSLADTFESALLLLRHVPEVAEQMFMRSRCPCANSPLPEHVGLFGLHGGRGTDGSSAP